MAGVIKIMLCMISVISLCSCFISVDEDLAEEFAESEYPSFKRSIAVDVENETASAAENHTIQVEDFNWPTEAVSADARETDITELFEKYDKIFINNEDADGNSTAVSNVTTTEAFEGPSTYDFDNATASSAPIVEDESIINQFDNSSSWSVAVSSPEEFNTTVIVEPEAINVTVPLIESVEKIPDKEIRDEFNKEVETVPHVSLEASKPLSPLDDLSGYVIEDSTMEYSAGGYEERLFVETEMKPTSTTLSKKEEQNEISFVEKFFETVTRKPEQVAETETQKEVTELPTETAETVSTETEPTLVENTTEIDFERRKEQQLEEEEISTSVLNETFYEKSLDQEAEEEAKEEEEELMLAMESGGNLSLEVEEVSFNTTEAGSNRLESREADVILEVVSEAVETSSVTLPEAVNEPEATVTTTEIGPEEVRPTTLALSSPTPPPLAAANDAVDEATTIAYEDDNFVATAAAITATAPVIVSQEIDWSTQAAPQIELQADSRESVGDNSSREQQKGAKKLLEPHSQVVVAASKNTRELVEVGVKNALAQEIVSSNGAERSAGGNKDTEQMVIATTIAFIVLSIISSVAIAGILLTKRLRAIRIDDDTTQPA